MQSIMWDIFYLEFTSTLEKHYFIHFGAETNTIKLINIQIFVNAILFIFKYSYMSSAKYYLLFDTIGNNVIACVDCIKTSVLFIINIYSI